MGVMNLRRGGPRTVRVFQFTKAGSMQLSSTDLENAAASAVAGAANGATFVTLRSERGLEHLFVTDDAPGQNGVAFSVARAIAGRSDEVDEVPDLLSVPGLAALQFRRGTTPLQDTQSGADFSALSRIIGDMLTPGEWLAVSVREAGQRWEVRAQSRWLDYHGMRTHHSRKSGAPVAAFWAGAKSNDRAREILLRAVSAIPGFGLSVRSRVVSPHREARWWLLAGVAAVAVGFGGPLLAPDVLDGALTHPVSIGAGIVCAAAALLTSRGFLPSAWRNARVALASGRVPRAPRRATPPRPPKTERTTVGADGARVVTAAFDGDYPMARSAFLVGAHIPLAFVAPHAGASSGKSTTMSRSAPPALLEKIGPTVGEAEGERVHLSVADFWSGVGVFGLAGSGKSALLEHLWGAASRDRVQPSATPGAPRQHCLIAFDTKGDGLSTQEYMRWSAKVGDRALVVQVSDPSDPVGIDLFPYSGSRPIEWSRQVVAAMRYVWGDESIGPESSDTLQRVLAAAVSLTPAMVSRVTYRPVPTDRSPFYYANILLSNEGDELGVELASTLGDAAAQPGAPAELVQVATSLAPLYGAGRTSAQRAALVKAPRTKVAALMSAEHWWSRPSKITWASILANDIPTIINTGAAPDGTLPDDKLRTDMSGLMLYTLHEEIKRTCRGWYEQGRAVSIFSDEVKNIAASSADVIAWMRNDARANGVRPVFATQYPDQLAEQVRRTVLGFGTLVLFAQNDGDTVKLLVGDLRLAGTDWGTADITNLDKYEAIVRATVGQQRLEPFTVHVPDFRAEREAGTWEG